MKIITAVLGGIAGAAQVSTAYLISHPEKATDVGLTGAGGWYLVWSVPLGALSGVIVGWMLARYPSRASFWPEVRKALSLSLGLGFLAAVIAPGMLGLGPQSAVQMWQGLAVLSGVAWTVVMIGAYAERHS